MGKRKRPARAVPAKEGAPISVASGAEILAGMVRQELAALASAKGTATQRQNQIKRCVATLKMLGDLTGETREMPEGKVVRLPAFRRMLDVLNKALEPFPEAMVAVGKALEAAEKGNSV